MNLTSCDNCGTVLDKDKLNFPDENYVWDEDAGTIDETKAKYNQRSRDWGVYVPCPVCKADVFKE